MNSVLKFFSGFSNNWSKYAYPSGMLFNVTEFFDKHHKRDCLFLVIGNLFFRLSLIYIIASMPPSSINS